jgi:hypothetical protein
MPSSKLSSSRAPMAPISTTAKLAFRQRPPTATAMADGAAPPASKTCARAHSGALGSRVASARPAGSSAPARPQMARARPLMASTRSAPSVTTTPTHSWSSMLAAQPSQSVAGAAGIPD